MAGGGRRSEGREGQREGQRRTGRDRGTEGRDDDGVW